jgi:putative transposase
MVDHIVDTSEPRGRIDIQVGVGRRRRWSDQAKGRMVAESYAPGAVVSEVARRHGISPQHLFGWRKAARAGVLSLPADEAPLFVPNYGDTLHITLIRLAQAAPYTILRLHVAPCPLRRPRLPHHVTQRGNRRAPIFFQDIDYALYRDLLAERCRKAAVACWAYCLMPNHVHLVLVPATASPAPSARHRQYTGFVNARARWTGHLFQGRFSSVALDEEHLMLTARYVALNPVRARLVDQPQDWAWSSLRAHIAGSGDGLVTVAPLLQRLGRITALVDIEPEETALARLRTAEATGRPLGSDEFVTQLERLMQRRLRRQKPGRKAKAQQREGDLFSLETTNERSIG